MLEIIFFLYKKDSNFGFSTLLVSPVDSKRYLTGGVCAFVPFKKSKYIHVYESVPGD